MHDHAPYRHFIITITEPYCHHNKYHSFTSSRSAVPSLCPPNLASFLPLLLYLAFPCLRVPCSASPPPCLCACASSPTTPRALSALRPLLTPAPPSCAPLIPTIPAHTPPFASISVSWTPLPLPPLPSKSVSAPSSCSADVLAGPIPRAFLALSPFLSCLTVSSISSFALLSNIAFSGCTLLLYVSHSSCSCVSNF